MNITLTQDRIWVDIKGREHTIATMDPHHAWNVCRMMERQAEQLWTREQYMQLLAWQKMLDRLGTNPDLDEAMAVDMLGEEWHDEVAEEEPIEWLRRTPLYRALEARSLQGKVWTYELRNRLYRFAHPSYRPRRLAVRAPEPPPDWTI